MFHPRDSAPITCRAPAIIQSKERFASALLTWFATRRQNICGILGLLRLAINIFPCTYSPAHIPLPIFPCPCADDTAGTGHGHKSGVGSTAIYIAGERSGLPRSYLLKRRAALVPPKPKEFERA